MVEPRDASNGELDWPALVRQYNLLGIWHATQLLKLHWTVGDPADVARDVVQQTWLTLWKRRKFSKGLFITVVLGLASNAVRNHRPIETAYKRRESLSPPKKRSGATVKMTSTFPVQIFGCRLCETTMAEDLEEEGCGNFVHIKRR